MKRYYYVSAFWRYSQRLSGTKWTMLVLDKLEKLVLDKLEKFVLDKLENSDFLTKKFQKLQSVFQKVLNLLYST